MLISKDMFYTNGQGTAFRKVLAPLLPWAVTELVCRFRAGRFDPKPVNWFFGQAAYFADGTLNLLQKELGLNGWQKRSPVSKHLRRIMVDADCKGSECDLLRLNNICAEQNLYSNPMFWTRGFGTVVCAMERGLLPGRPSGVSATTMDHRLKKNMKKLAQFCTAKGIKKNNVKKHPGPLRYCFAKG
jgi:hypothetical protein